MSVYDVAFVNTELSKRTSIFGLRFSRRQRHRSKVQKLFKPSESLTPVVSKEIQEIVHLPTQNHHQPPPPPEIHVDTGKAEYRVVVYSDRVSSGESRGTGSVCETTISFGGGSVGPEVSHLGWGRWYTLRELEVATNGLCEENVIGEGGVVYSGVLSDGTRIAVKNLLNNSLLISISHLLDFHKGAYRMLVYDYVDNGNLDQWLHGNIGDVCPPTWDICMNIILGTAKGLAYLHEGLEPKVVHRDVKSSNYITTRVMGTFGYVAPEYACTGMLNEKSDVYSFGILIMEIVSGRSPVDYSRPQGEVNLVDWLKSKAGSQKSEEVVDPKLLKIPASKVLKRILLVALRCVDPDAIKRHKMGHVVHMLEADDLLIHDLSFVSFLNINDE
ncbi:Kinase family protein [Quillaja saponaria]|uniref:non-specific serine/threonine protein kinase n=1 Tax=Quillaja saponaria TaxID=32244 RepID=A0AAD7L4I8_QUISA|nr:Kinase family protein [Quillaja saponaria]